MDTSGFSPEPLIDPNLDEPQLRSRCNTWPLRPVLTSPAPVEYDNPCSAEPAIQEEPEGFQGSSHDLSGNQDCSITLNTSNPESDSAGKKNGAARKNPWGNASYAEMITQAIQSSPEQRLTLAQVYDWIVQNVPYFNDKGDSNSSAGWKNSVRHNLSLHQKFMKVQNEGAGKSSWWMINPDAKAVRGRRRGGSMDSKSMKVKRERAMKNVREKRSLMGAAGQTPANVSPYQSQELSPLDAYRERASSFASSIHDDSHDQAGLSVWDSEPQVSDYQDYSAMDTGKLHDELADFNTLNLDNMSDSFMQQLSDISQAEYNPPNQTVNMYSTGKPYERYSQGNVNGYSQPAPSYSSMDQQPQTSYIAPPNKVVNNDEPLTYVPTTTTNNNTLVSQFNGGFQANNRGFPNSTSPVGLSQRGSTNPPTTKPSSIRAALQSNPPNISPALKAVSPILTQQLLNAYSAPSPSSGQVSAGQNIQPREEPLFLPDDLDNIDEMLPDQLNCNVDEVIRQELALDGGLLDTSGFEGYSQYPNNGLFSS